MSGKVLTISDFKLLNGGSEKMPSDLYKRDFYLIDSGKLGIVGKNGGTTAKHIVKSKWHENIVDQTNGVLQELEELEDIVDEDKEPLINVDIDSVTISLKVLQLKLNKKIGRSYYLACLYLLSINGKLNNLDETTLELIDKDITYLKNQYKKAFNVEYLGKACNNNHRKFIEYITKFSRREYDSFLREFCDMFC